MDLLQSYAAKFAALIQLHNLPGFRPLQATHGDSISRLEADDLHKVSQADFKDIVRVLQHKVIVGVSLNHARCNFMDNAGAFFYRILGRIFQKRPGACLPSAPPRPLAGIRP